MGSGLGLGFMERRGWEGVGDIGVSGDGMGSLGELGGFFFLVVLLFQKDWIW